MAGKWLERGSERTVDDALHALVEYRLAQRAGGPLGTAARVRARREAVARAAWVGGDPAVLAGRARRPQPCRARLRPRGGLVVDGSRRADPPRAAPVRGEGTSSGVRRAPGCRGKAARGVVAGPMCGRDGRRGRTCAPDPCGRWLWALDCTVRSVAQHAGAVGHGADRPPPDRCPGRVVRGQPARHPGGGRGRGHHTGRGHGRSATGAATPHRHP
jgi:hypothetical protein